MLSLSFRLYGQQLLGLTTRATTLGKGKKQEVYRDLRVGATQRERGWPHFTSDTDSV